MEPNEDQEPTLPSEGEPTEPASGSPEPDADQAPALPSQEAAAEPSAATSPAPLTALRQRGPARRVFSWAAAMAAVLVIALITTTLLISHAASPGPAVKGHATPGAKPTPLSVYGLANPAFFNFPISIIQPVNGTSTPTTPAPPPDGSVFALNAADGSLRWQDPTPGVAETGQVVAGDVLYTGSTHGTVYAFTTDTGKLLWSVTLLQRSKVQQVVDGVVYALAADSASNSQATIYALDARNGKQLWQLTNGASIDLVSAGTVYVSTYSDSSSSSTGTVYALDARSGTERWHFQEPGTLTAQRAADGQVYIINEQAADSGEGFFYMVAALYALDASTGAQRWSYPKNPSGRLSLAGAENGMVYLLTNDLVPFTSPTHDGLAALSAADGSVQWQQEIPPVPLERPSGTTLIAAPFISEAVLSNGVIYLGSTFDPISAYKASDGSLLWSTTQLLPNTLNESPAVEMVADGVVYVRNLGISLNGLSQDTGLYALDASTGKLLWKQVGKLPAIGGAVNGVVYIDANNSIVLALDAQTGAVRWTYSLGKETVSITVQ